MLLFSLKKKSFYPLDSCFDIDHDATLCGVFSLINNSALRFAAAEQQVRLRLKVTPRLGDGGCKRVGETFPREEEPILEY